MTKWFGRTMKVLCRLVGHKVRYDPGEAPGSFVVTCVRCSFSQPWHGHVIAGRPVGSQLPYPPPALPPVSRTVAAPGEMRIECLECDTMDGDLVHEIPQGWANVEKRADPPAGDFDWATHHGCCPDCRAGHTVEDVQALAGGRAEQRHE